MIAYRRWYVHFKSLEQFSTFWTWGNKWIWRKCHRPQRNCLTVPRCRLSTYGCRAFDYASLTVWNSLPV